MRRAWRISSSSGGYFRHALVGVPGFHQQLGEEAAGRDQERPGAHGRVADLQVEDLLGRRGSGRGVPGSAGASSSDDRLGERARRVVRARPPALVGRLEDHRPCRNDVRASPRRSTAFQGRHDVLGRLRVLQAVAAWPVTAWSAFSLSHFARSAGLARAVPPG